MEIREIPLSEIDRGDRLRKVDPDFARMIADSFAQHGQRTPIEVRPVAAGRFRLIAGAHRVAAAEHLGWATIQAVEKVVDDLTAALLEIDENLMRHELTALDRAAFLAQRKTIYDQMHPETAVPGRRNKIAANLAVIRTFSEDVADRLKINDRAVRKAVALYRSLSPEVCARLSGTKIANNATWLSQIGAIKTPGRQLALVEEMLRPDALANPAVAKERLYGRSATAITERERKYRRFVADWSMTFDEVDGLRGDIVAYLKRQGFKITAPKNGG